MLMEDRLWINFLVIEIDMLLKLIFLTVYNLHTPILRFLSPIKEKAEECNGRYIMTKALM